MKNNEMKKWAFLILIGVFAYWGLNNLNIIFNILVKVFNVLLPFILGGALAFILNIPMKNIENFLKRKITNKDKLVRVISIILSLLLFLGVILFVAFLLLPELITNITALIGSIPELINHGEEYLLDLLDKYPDIQTQIENAFSGAGNISDIVSNLLNYFLNGAVSFIGDLISGFITLFMGLIFSIYMLSQKEYLIRGSKKIIYATMNEKNADKIIDVGKDINRTFSKFLSGQCLEAIILGTLVFIACSIFKFPYALLISVLATITSLIPIIGALIALAGGFVLIAISNPIEGLWFIAVFEIVQQFEANIIYPRVVGKSIGLSPLWTLLTITIGGKLFGIIGMIIGLPLASVIYSLIREFVYSRLKEKRIEIS